MRKTLSIVLSIVMVLSLAIIGVSAEGEPTVITTAAEFANMAADGNYKLGADITIDASYGAGETVTTFTGTFDGDGHTVTISAPMFVQFAGTIKNLKIEGSVTVTGTTNAVASYCGAIAKAIPGGSATVTFDNVVNNANITNEYRGGGFIGQASSGNTIIITNCVNNGTVSGGNMVGGFIGYSQNNDITVKDCINNGKVYIDVSRELNGRAGGFFARTGADTAYKVNGHKTVLFDNCLNNGEVFGTSNTAGFMAIVQNADITFRNCTNKADITSGYTAANTGCGDAAGILSATGSGDGYYAKVFVDKCVNEGKIVSKNNRVSGIVSYVWCGGYDNDYMHAEITDCVNSGALEGGSFISQLLAYSNDTRETPETIIKGVGIGSVARCADSKRDPEPNADGKNSAYFAVVGVSSSSKTASYQYDLTLLASNRLDWVGYSEGTPANRVAITEKPATIKLVTLEQANAAIAALGEIGYIAPKQDPIQPPVTGDNLVFVAVVAVVAVLGMGIAIKAKKD